MGPGLIALKMLMRPSQASGTDLLPGYERAFAQTIVGRDVPTLAFGRGRVALWSILKALDASPDSEVVVPAYTCETVPMAVKFAGALCVYADVDTGAYNVSIENAAQALTDRTQAVICQHTYGMPQPIQDWIHWASTRDVVLIEDRCQFLGGRSDVNAVGSLADAAYFSTHFSKPFSTAQGGMAAFSDADLCARVQKLRDGFARDNARRQVRSLASQALLYAVAVRPATRAMAGRLFRWAQRAGLIRGTVSRAEYGNAMPADYLSSAHNLHAALGMRELGRWDQNRQHRQKLTRFYLDQLASLDVDCGPCGRAEEAPARLMVPVLVTNKEEVLRRTAGRALPIGTWFDRCPAHLDPQTAHHYDYEPGQCPRTEYLIPREIHLLTAPWVSLSQAERGIRFLDKYAHWASPPERPAIGQVAATQFKAGEG